MNWKDINSAPRTGEDIWLYFPLEGLDKSWERVKACYWRPDIELWVYKGRACRSYSRGYNPTHWQPYTEIEPEPPK